MSTLTKEICRKYIEEVLFEPNDKSLTASAVGKVGVELEIFSFIVNSKNSQEKIPVPITGNGVTLEKLLLDLAKKERAKIKIWNADSSFPKYCSQLEEIEFPDGDRLTFEPGGQVEISTSPCNDLMALQSHLCSKQNLLDELTESNGVRFFTCGTHPWFDVKEIKNQLIKPRYQALEKYFDSIGPYGKQMMLQTGSMHINLDLGFDRSTIIRRIVASNLLVPFTTAMFANSPMIQGEITGKAAYRSFLWQHLDGLRSGMLKIEGLPQLPDIEKLISSYLEFALKAPIIYIPELGSQVMPLHFTFEYWLKHAIEGIRPNEKHLKNHLTLLFPEVRLKGYLELRSVDAPPKEWQMLPVLFYSGLLYNDVTLNKTLDLLLPLSHRIHEFRKSAVDGFDSNELYSICLKLMHLAMEGFSELPLSFKGDNFDSQFSSFFELFTHKRKSFSEDTLVEFMA